MINKKLFENETEVKYEATREGFGRGLTLAGKQNEKVIALCADLTDSVQMGDFKKTFPERFVQVGVAEQNMVGVASGMAAMGMIPVAASYAAFSPGRNWEQIRTMVCYNDQKVIIIGAHSGLSVGPDGGTHQMLEDIALMRSLPNMTVISPSDSVEAEKLFLQCIDYPSPIYFRLAREKSLVLYDKSYEPKIGKAEVVYNTNKNSNQKIGLIVTGPILSEAVFAAKDLENKNLDITILNVHTIKPIDEQSIIRLASQVNHIITLEEAQIIGGLGSAVAEVLSKNKPTKLTMMGVNDKYGQSGSVVDLYNEYGISREHIKQTILSLMGF